MMSFILPLILGPCCAFFSIFCTVLIKSERQGWEMWQNVSLLSYWPLWLELWIQLTHVFFTSSARNLGWGMMRKWETICFVSHWWLLFLPSLIQETQCTKLYWFVCVQESLDSHLSSKLWRFSNLFHLPLCFEFFEKIQKVWFLQTKPLSWFLWNPCDEFTRWMRKIFNNKKVF